MSHTTGGSSPTPVVVGSLAAVVAPRVYRTPPVSSQHDASLVAMPHHPMSHTQITAMQGIKLGLHQHVPFRVKLWDELAVLYARRYMAMPCLLAHHP